MRIFVYSAGLPRFDVQAGDRRFAEFLRILAQTHQVDLCLRLNEADPSNPRLAAATDRYRRYLADVGVRLIAPGWRHTEGALLTNTYDIGLFEFYYHAAEILPLFRRLQPQARAITDSVDLHYIRERAATDLGLLPAGRAEETRRKELAIYRESDMVVAVSEWDRATLEGEGQLPPMAVIPIIVPTRPRPKLERAKELLFVGGFDHVPNLHGLKWFVAECWPRIRAAEPDTTLTVIGSNVRPEIAAMAELPGVRVLGFVPDTAPHLDRAAISIAPLKFGSGMKGKVIEAMAHGLPVVTTSIGAQGLSVSSGEQLVLAEEPVEFADAIVHLLRSPTTARQIGLAGQAYVADTCSPEVAARLTDEMLALASSLTVDRAPLPEADRVLGRIRFESLRLLSFPRWGPDHFYRYYVKSRLRTARDRFIRRYAG